MRLFKKLVIGDKTAQLMKEQIERHLELADELMDNIAKGHEIDQAERKIEMLKTYKESKHLSKRVRLDINTCIQAAISILGLLVILSHEKEDTLSSKAVGLVTRGISTR